MKKQESTPKKSPAMTVARLRSIAGLPEEVKTWKQVGEVVERAAHASMEIKSLQKERDEARRERDVILDDSVPRPSEEARKGRAIPELSTPVGAALRDEVLQTLDLLRATPSAGHISDAIEQDGDISAKTIDDMLQDCYMHLDVIQARVQTLGWAAEALQLLKK